MHSPFYDSPRIRVCLAVEVWPRLHHASLPLKPNFKALLTLRLDLRSLSLRSSFMCFIQPFSPQTYSPMHLGQITVSHQAPQRSDSLESSKLNDKRGCLYVPSGKDLRKHLISQCPPKPLQIIAGNKQQYNSLVWSGLRKENIKKSHWQLALGNYFMQHRPPLPISACCHF